jgi:hypothetical protein
MWNIRSPALQGGTHVHGFNAWSDIQKESQVVLDSTEKNDFHCAFEAWKKRWDHFIRS